MLRISNTKIIIIIFNYFYLSKKKLIEKQKKICLQNKRQSELWLGVTALGLNVYERENKLAPTITFTWAEIRDISFENKKFILKTVDKLSPNFVFFSKKVRMNKLVRCQLNKMCIAYSLEK